MSTSPWPIYDRDDTIYDDFDDDEVSEYSQEEYEDMARQIRSLSNVIWLTGEHTTLPHHTPPANIDLRSVYRSLATLLTRDSRQEICVAVTGDGTNMGDATQFIALFPYRNDLEEPHVSTEAYTGADYDMLDAVPSEIEPHFGDGWTENPQSDHDHACCVMGILWSFAAEPQALCLLEHELRRTALRFLYSQCWPEVRRCAEGANYIPKSTLTWHHIGMLDGYIPLPDELCDATFQPIPSYISHRFASRGVQRLYVDADMNISPDDDVVDDSGDLYAFSPITARVWFSILCDAVYDVLLQCEPWNKEHLVPKASQMDGVVESITELHALFNLDAMQQLLCFPSLQRYLDLHHPHLNPDIRPMLPRTRSEPKAFNRAEHKILEEWRERESIVGRLRRHVEGLLSWQNALTTLVDAMVYAQHDPPIILRLLRYRRPSSSWREPLQDSSVRDVLEMDRPLQSAKYEDVWRYLVDRLPDTDDLSVEQRRELDLEIEERVKILELQSGPEDFSPKAKSRAFEGSVHTEALLMDFLAQGDPASESVIEHPSLRTFVDYHGTFNRLVGVPLQYEMCYCCTLLEARLLHEDRPLFSSVRGPVVPWTPPLLLHKDDALEALHGALVQLMANIIETQEEAARAATPTGTMVAE